MSDLVRVAGNFVEVDELEHILSLASRREQGVAWWLDVFSLPIVGVEESFRMMPHTV